MKVLCVNHEPGGPTRTDIDGQVEVTQPGGKDAVKITKQGERWQVVSPYDKPADQSVVKSAVESLEKIKWGDITTQQKERHAELEVSDDKAIHVVA